MSTKPGAIHIALVNHRAVPLPESLRGSAPNRANEHSSVLSPRLFGLALRGTNRNGVQMYSTVLSKTPQIADRIDELTKAWNRGQSGKASEKQGISGLTNVGDPGPLARRSDLSI